MATRKGKGQEGFDEGKLFKPTVPDGTPLNEAVSIMIKELRRGKELEAVYWARQIESNFHKYLWRRLEIFCAEDVGLGDPAAIVVVRALKGAYMDAKSESRADKPDGNLVVMACLYLARATKNREADHLKNLEYTLMERRGWRPEIPEYAIDAHTERGRAIYRTQADRDRGWFMEWSKVVPEVGPYDARLWHLRRIAHEGVIDIEEVEEMARRWDEEGELLYGIDGGYPTPNAPGGGRWDAQ